MFEFKHPSYYAKIKKENRLTNKENYDKEIDNEKIQNNTKRHGNIRNRNNRLQRRTNSRASRK
jgi:hypothetical protein